jgi:hypothetical protein
MPKKSFIGPFAPIQSINLNWYFKTYNQIIERAMSRTITGYVERHHILPKSLNGNDNKFNIARLTAREHFICHQVEPTNGLK